MSTIANNPKKLRRLERKFRIGKREWRIVAYREIERFKKLSWREQLNINKMYAKVVMNANLVCRHDARHTITQYDMLKGYTVVTHKCFDCHKVLQIDIYKTQRLRE